MPRVIGAGVFPSMEGRAIARPNDPRVHRTNLPGAPSMEGRAIARPNHANIADITTRERLQWRGGLLPGRTGLTLPQRGVAQSLQWRAGLLPGRTFQSLRATLAYYGPSMEGRAIARPNSHSPPLRVMACAPFNGGPGYCPAELPSGEDTPPAISSLQWRAGLLPGRTA